MAFPLWSWCTEKRDITQALHTYTLIHQRLLIETPGCPLGDRACKPPLKSSCHYPHSPPPDHCPFLPALQFISALFRSFLPPLVRPRTLRYTPKKQSLTHACKQISENACPHTWHSFRAGLVGSSMHSLWAILASPYVLPVVHRSSFNLYKNKNTRYQHRVDKGFSWALSLVFYLLLLDFQIFCEHSVWFIHFQSYFSPSTAMCFKVIFMHSSFSIFPLVICTGHLAQETISAEVK